MAVNDGIAFWNALKVKVKALIKQDTFNCFRMERYDVTTVPNGSTIGVTLPEGTTEIHIPYSTEVASASLGDTVMVGWRGSLSNARAMWFGKGYAGNNTNALSAYPVGSIYMSVNSTSPATLFGGTWERIQDTFLLSAGTTYGAGTTGGSISSTSGSPSTDETGSTALTVAQMPNHGHGVNVWDDAGTQSAAYYYSGDTQVTASVGRLYNGSASSWKSSSFNAAQQGRGDPSGGTELVGGGDGHTHTLSAHTHSVDTMPPYLAVYVWKRTA